MNDPTTGLPVLLKQPAEERLLDISFVNKLRETDTINSITGITQTKMGIVSGSTDLTIGIPQKNAAGTKVQARYSAGTDGEHYKLEAIVITVGGDTLENDVMLYVED